MHIQYSDHRRRLDRLNRLGFQHLREFFSSCTLLRCPTVFVTASSCSIAWPIKIRYVLPIYGSHDFTYTALPNYQTQSLFCTALHCVPNAVSTEPRIASHYATHLRHCVRFTQLHGNAPEFTHCTLFVKHCVHQWNLRYSSVSGSAPWKGADK